MRRVETYVGQQVYEWLFSSQAQQTMTAIAKVCAAMLGTSVTVNGLPCTPTTPASMTVQIGAGELYQLQALEATNCGTLPADTSHQILKQGIRLDTFTTGTFAAPVTSGQSINYLIEAQYQDSDISLDPTTGNSPVVLQFYNAENPGTPWSGPNNSGSTSNTFRDGTIAYQIKAGVAATTGSQVTPTPDAGWTGLWVITVPFGATSLTSSNIAQYTGAPVLPSGMLQSILTSNLTYGIDGGTANVVQATFPIPVTSLTDGMNVWVKVKTANTGATTFTPNPGVISAAPVVGSAHAALQGGELAANGRANLVWRQDISSWVLTECTGGAMQVAPATQSEHAMQLGQATGRLLRTSVYTNVGGTQYVSVNGAAPTTTGATTWSALSSTNVVEYEGCGDGAGSSGAGGQGASTVGIGASGGSGAWGRGRLTSGFGGTQTITVGPGGTAGTAAPTNGGGGTGTSFGTLASWPGGAASTFTNGVTTPAIVGAGTGGPAPSGCNVFGSAGNSAEAGIFASVSVGVSGKGGDTPYGAGGPSVAAGTAGQSGSGYGSGASGAAVGGSGTGQPGAVGRPGILIVREFS